MDEVAVNPGEVLERIAERKRIDTLVPVAVQEVDETIVPIATGDDRPHARLFNRFLRQRRHMVADHNDLVVMRGNPRPMAFDDRGLRLEDDVVGLERGEPGVKFLQREFRGDSVEEQDLVPRLLQHRRRGRGNDGEDVGRA